MAHVVHSYTDLPAAAHACAVRVAHLLREMIGVRGKAHLGLSGGNTPKPMYALLAGLPDIDWSVVHFWWGDERCVPRTDKNSNERMARESLLSHIPFVEENVHTLPTTLAPAECAAAYEAEMRRTCEVDPKTSMPVIDILLLGIGDDGHTLSLFPRSPTLAEAARAVASTQAPPTSPVKDRVTLTFPAARSARYRVFLAAGADKKPVVAGCLAQPPADQPSARVGDAEWFLDAAATP
ncbi:MAG: 6-phosphogluconolactonase [Phycisphaeraceae bacterium]|nr:6-phosphogluconolactonase [Phycisphaeraceae bacterium]